MNPLVTQSISVHIDPNSSKTFHPHILKFPYLKTLTQFNQDMKLKNPADLLPSKNIDIQIRISHELSFHPQLRHIKKVYLLLAISNLFFILKPYLFIPCLHKPKSARDIELKRAFFSRSLKESKKNFYFLKTLFICLLFFACATSDNNKASRRAKREVKGMKYKADCLTVSYIR